MNSTVRATTGALCAMLTTFAVGQDTFSGVFYDLKEKRVIPVVSGKLEEAKNVFGIRGFDLQLHGLKNLNTGLGVGFSIQWVWTGASDRFGLTIGFGGNIDREFSSALHWGPTLGITMKF